MSITKQVHTELSELDEFFGRPARAPLASLETYIKYETSKQNEIIQNSSREIGNEIQLSTQNICGTLQEGFENLYEVNSIGFNKVSENLETLNATLTSGIIGLGYKLDSIENTMRWGFSKLIEQVKITNQKLENVIKLLNIPDIQKERKYYIEQGLNFLVKGKSSPVFIEKAINNFQKALEIEDTDYFTFSQLGFIHLFFKEFLDIEKSRAYLNKAILFGEADINFNSASLGQHSSSFDFNYNPSTITSNSLMYLGQIYYREHNFEKAYELAKKGYEINPKNLRVGFDLSKYSICTNRIEPGVTILEEIIEQDRHISIKAISDEDLAKSKFVRDYLNHKSKLTYQLAYDNFQKIQQEIRPDSIYFDKVKNIEELVGKKQYLSSLNALELIGYELKN